ncbi:MAG: class I SAM-dependent methyltransferase, partial [Alphaproteobacteria bacterium]|nr:class I SAM-dependent methyltransferase [Alphaproteobacteria bacterium]
GTGAAALSLAARLRGVRVTGLEAAADLVALARESARESGVADRVAFVEGDLKSPPASLKPGTYDHVMANRIMDEFASHRYCCFRSSKEISMSYVLLYVLQIPNPEK